MIVNVENNNAGIWALRQAGGEQIAWDGRPWCPGKARARFSSDLDAKAFASAHNLTVLPARGLRQ